MSNETAATTPYRYDAAMAAEIEARWQDRWEREGTFEAPNPVGDLAGAAELPSEKFFIMDMFPYPSGAGLHVGHPLGYIATDVVGRHRRMLGENVLHALGYDAFGLPAEQYAVQTGQHPRTTTEQNIVTMRQQLRRLGLAHDHRRSFATIDPEFVRWTQWIFLQIFNAWFDPRANAGKGAARPIGELIKEFAGGVRKTSTGVSWQDLSATDRNAILDDYRLAYLSETPVNWCPGLGTVLANEEVTADGRSERGNFPVFTRSLRQWNMRITAYADRLVDDLERVDWPVPVKLMQRNWIGRSSGATVRFAVEETAEAIEVFTTRPDTLFGATYLVLAPEHPLLETVVPAQWPDDLEPRWRGGAASPPEWVTAYRSASGRKTEGERQENKDKTGVFTGAYATNPVNGQRLPIFVSDYVLMEYGTGAIMAVPGQDQRDWDFAVQFGLPIIRTVQPSNDFAGEAYTGPGEVINSAVEGLILNGLDTEAAKKLIMEWLERHDAGSRTTTYRLRDWLFSRQRYWGEPFPIVYGEDDQPIALPDSMLPVDLPELEDYSPRTFEADDATSVPEPPLARNADWVNVELDLGDGPKPYRRETNTMPNWAGSSWYEIRYTDPHNTDAMAATENERYWLGPRQEGGTGGVDLYVGGVEHAVLHLLYARFWHKVLFDLGHVSSEEPFQRLFNQGYIQAAAFTDARGFYVPAEEVDEGVDDAGRSSFFYKGEPVERSYGKMGKSLKNSVNPDDMYAAYGADTFRVYEMSMGPLDDSRPWETRAVVGGQRFLQRLWRLVVDEDTGETISTEVALDRPTLIMLNRTIAGVTEDLDRLHLNTAISKLIAYTSFLTKQGLSARAAVEPLIKMLAPIAPHICEELWHRLGHDATITYEPYPVANQDYLVADTVTCVVQVNGKVRARLDVAAEVSESELEKVALEDPNVRRFIADRPVRKIIIRVPKLVNIVI